MASSKKDLDTLVQYTAEKLTTYMEMPREQRRELRKQQAMRRESWSYRWFGMLPYSTMLGIRAVLRNLKNLKQKLLNTFREIKRETK